MRKVCTKMVTVEPNHSLKSKPYPMVIDASRPIVFPVYLSHQV